MDVRYHEEDKFFNAELLRDSNWTIFQLIADELSETFKVQWKQKVDGFDQRYWDFEFKGALLTLHLEHFLGISIFVEKTHPDIEKARQVLEEIGNHFKIWKPQN